MDGHHLIMGTLTDYLTGRVVDDTHDERYRQKIARFLVEKKAYRAADILSRQDTPVRAGDRKAVIPVDFLIQLNDHKCMMIQYAPGSIVTRRRSTLAVSRLASGVYLPVVVVTNGEDAEVLDGRTGRLIGGGFQAIPGRGRLQSLCVSEPLMPVAPDQIAVESRIAYAFEVDGRCPCDDTVCRLPNDAG